MEKLSVLLLLCVGGAFLSWPSATHAAPALDSDFSDTYDDIKNTGDELWSKTKNFFNGDTSQRTEACVLINGSWKCSHNGTVDTKPPSTFSKGVALVNGFASHAWNETKNFFNPKATPDNPEASWWSRFKGQFSKSKPPARHEVYFEEPEPKYKRATLPCVQRDKTASDMELPCSNLPNVE